MQNCSVFSESNVDDRITVALLTSTIKARIQRPENNQHAVWSNNTTPQQTPNKMEIVLQDDDTCPTFPGFEEKILYYVTVTSQRSRLLYIQTLLSLKKGRNLLFPSSLSRKRKLGFFRFNRTMRGYTFYQRASRAFHDYPYLSKVLVVVTVRFSILLYLISLLFIIHLIDLFSVVY